MELEQSTILSSKSSAMFSSDSQQLNVVNFADLMVFAFNTFDFTVRNDVLLTDSKLRFRNQHRTSISSQKSASLKPGTSRFSAVQQTHRADLRDRRESRDRRVRARRPGHGLPVHPLHAHVLLRVTARCREVG